MMEFNIGYGLFEMVEYCELSQNKLLHCYSFSLNVRLQNESGPDTALSCRAKMNLFF